MSGNKKLNVAFYYFFDLATHTSKVAPNIYQKEPK